MNLDLSQFTVWVYGEDFISCNKLIDICLKKCLDFFNKYNLDDRNYDLKYNTSFNFCAIRFSIKLK